MMNDEVPETWLIPGTDQLTTEAIQSVLRHGWKAYGLYVLGPMLVLACREVVERRERERPG